MATRISFTTSFLFVAAIAYTLFYILFVIGQRTWSIALLVSALYFIPFIYGSHVKNATVMLVCIVIHAIASLTQLGFSIYFFVEIFITPKTTIVKWLSKYSRGSNQEDGKGRGYGRGEGRARDGQFVAKYACIAMSVDGFITFLVLLAAFYLTLIKWRSLNSSTAVQTRRNITPPPMEETLAVNLEFETPITIPRLRTTSSWDTPTASYSPKRFSTYQTRF